MTVWIFSSGEGGAAELLRILESLLAAAARRSPDPTAMADICDRVLDRFDATPRLMVPTTYDLSPRTINSMYVCAKNRSSLEKVLPGARRKSYMHVRGFRDRKPRTCTGLQRCNYAESGRLESCSRDPIGYRDGSNLYAAYFASFGDGVDPLGTTVCVGSTTVTTGSHASGIGPHIGAGGGSGPITLTEVKEIYCECTKTTVITVTCTGVTGLCWPFRKKRTWVASTTTTVTATSSTRLPVTVFIRGSSIPILPLPGNQTIDITIYEIEPADKDKANRQCKAFCNGSRPGSKGNVSDRAKDSI